MNDMCACKVLSSIIIKKESLLVRQKYQAVVDISLLSALEGPIFLYLFF